MSDGTHENEFDEVNAMAMYFVMEIESLRAEVARLTAELAAMTEERDTIAAALNFAVEELRRMGYTGALRDPAAILATRDAAIRKPLEEERDALRDDYEQLRSIPKVNTLEPHWRCAVCGLVAMPLTDDSTCNCSDPDEDEHWERIDPPAILATVRAKARAEGFRDAAKAVRSLERAPIMYSHLMRLADAEEAGKGAIDAAD